MFQTILLSLLKQILSSEEFRAFLQKAIQDEITSNASLGHAVAALNDRLKLISSRFDALGLKGKLLKRYVVELVKELADNDPAIASALVAGKPYFEAVLDGIDPEDIAKASIPVIDLVRAQAEKMAQQFIF